jgi:hypothetical protein
MTFLPVASLPQNESERTFVPRRSARLPWNHSRDLPALVLGSQVSQFRDCIVFARCKHGWKR